MIILGINGGVRLGYQDVSAVLIRDGKLLAAVEEERLSRVKHSPGQLPYLSIIEVLSIANVKITEVDIVATHGSTWGEQYDEVLRSYFKYTFGHSPRFIRYHHHLCHAASAFYASGMQEAMVLTIDASGDGISLQKAIGKNDELIIEEQITRDNSLGIFYSMMTQFCGFTRDTDEYKLMGLAPYGDSKKTDLSFLIEYGNGDYRVNCDYMQAYPLGQPQGSRQQAAFSNELTKKLGNPRIPNNPMDEHYINVAAASQALLEDVLCDVVKGFAEQTGIRHICMAGGVALNCAANRKILDLDCIDSLYIQPASSDAGISLGAAYLASAEFDIKPEPMTTALLGRAFADEEVKTVLGQLGAKHKYLAEPWNVATDLILDQKVLGWVNGRAEFGPRALGSRSIIASPFDGDMKNKINQRIKFREGFRPFCPSILEEDFNKAFQSSSSIHPNMTVNVRVTSDIFPAITHVDQTARVQTLSSENESPFAKLLKAMQQKTGTGIVVNTSFNRNKEPMVYSIIDAVSAFYGSGLDALFIGSFIVSK